MLLPYANVLIIHCIWETISQRTFINWIVTALINLAQTILFCNPPKKVEKLQLHPKKVNVCQIATLRLPTASHCKGCYQRSRKYKLKPAFEKNLNYFFNLDNGSSLEVAANLRQLFNKSKSEHFSKKSSRKPKLALCGTEPENKLHTHI